MQNTPDDEIKIVLDESDLSELLWKSDEYDLSPNDATICFNLQHIQEAKKIFEHHPDVASVDFRAEISSESFEGKLRGDRIKIFNPGEIVVAAFSNDWTGTQYEMDITSLVRQL